MNRKAVIFGIKGFSLTNKEKYLLKYLVQSLMTKLSEVLFQHHSQQNK